MTRQRLYYLDWLRILAVLHGFSIDTISIVSFIVTVLRSANKEEHRLPFSLWDEDVTGFFFLTTRHHRKYITW
jgi:hypothetical protein